MFQGEIKIEVRILKSITILVLMLTVFSFLGCKAISDSMQSWVGHSKAELYQSWGPPTRTTDDGQGGEILIYEQWVNTGQTAGQVYTDAWGNTRYTNPHQNGYMRTRMFYVNQKGTIYSWRFQGL